MPRLAFSHIISRQDTFRIAEAFAAKVSTIETHAQTSDLNDMVWLVKQVMQMYHLKSDVCDNNPDPRCNRPGRSVRRRMDRPHPA